MLQEKSSSRFPVQCRLTWVTFKQWFRQSCQIHVKVRMSMWWLCPQNMLCVQSQCRAIHGIKHHTATVGHSGEYLPFLQSPKFCHVSLLENPGVGTQSLETQTHACFEGHPLVYETTRQQHVEVSSAVLIYTTCKTHLSLLGTLSIILNFLCWCRWCAWSKGSIQDYRMEIGISVEWM